MIKNKLDFKLINIAIITVIIFLIYQMGRLWMGVFNTFLEIFIPFFFAFVVAYALHPITRLMQRKKIPKGLSIFIVIAVITGIIVLLTSLVVPLLFNQLSSLFNAIISFIKTISLDYDLNLGDLQTALSSGFNDIIGSLSKYISTGAANIIGQSLSYLSSVLIALAASVYFLIDMDNIRSNFKKFLLKKSKKLYRYVRLVDTEMKQYLSGFAKIAVISLFEYYFAFLLIGHPNALLIGFMASVAGIIPYFGGMANNALACITAFVISPKLFIASVIVSSILSFVDANVINPIVYGKTNKVHPIVVILSVFAGGILFGIVGIIISLPLAIIIISTYKFFRDDISDKIEEITGDKKKKA